MKLQTVIQEVQLPVAPASPPSIQQLPQGCQSLLRFLDAAQVLHELLGLLQRRHGNQVSSSSGRRSSSNFLGGLGSGFLAANQMVL